MSGITSSTAKSLRSGATLPATSRPGNCFIKTSGGSEGEYICLTANTWTGPFAAGTFAPATPSVNAQTGTTYTLQASDNSKIITLSNASAITVTVPSGLGAGFNCTCIQIGAGQVSFTGSGATVNNRQSHTKIAGQYGVVGLAAYAANVFALGGDTAA